MPSNTTTVWTCSRCGAVEEVEGTGHPKTWIRVGFVNPPKASWESVTVVGDLCNGPDCGGLIVDWMKGTEDKKRRHQRDYDAAMARVEAAIHPDNNTSSS